jgi:uncharacterized protein YjbI with pentapeptide repeats
MRKRLSSWWQKANKPIFAIEAMACLVVVMILILGYWLKWSWTGFSAKTLWDWLQLLFVPIILAIGGFWLNQIQREREERTAKRRAEDEQRIATDTQQEAALQAYIDHMSELLLNEHLRESAQEKEVRNIARVRTLTVLQRLDGERKGNVLQFLYESGLLHKDTPIIQLSGADLSFARLNETHLHGADLSFANLRSADLTRVDLGEADLHGADLSFANLRSANLSFADLSFAQLDGTTLSRADLHGAELSSANLHGANLRASDLGAANLRKANLAEAHLEMTNFSVADLSETYLKDARGTTLEELEEAKSLQGATMPDGSKHS